MEARENGEHDGTSHKSSRLHVPAPSPVRTHRRAADLVPLSSIFLKKSLERYSKVDRNLLPTGAERRLARLEHREDLEGKLSVGDRRAARADAAEKIVHRRRQRLLGGDAFERALPDHLRGDGYRVRSRRAPCV